MDKNQPFSDELISAYLDGELTSDEQARVEQTLSESATHRQMLEELKALRSNLQSLPPLQLDEDFSRRVLRRAEREMLAPRPDREPLAVLQEEAGSTGSDVSQKKTVVWPWIATISSLAAAAVLMIYLFAPPQGQEVAMQASREKEESSSGMIPESDLRFSSELEQKEEPASDLFFQEEMDARPAFSLESIGGSLAGGGGNEKPDSTQVLSDSLATEDRSLGLADSSAASVPVEEDGSFSARPGDQLLVWIDIPRTKKHLQQIDQTLLKNNMTIAPEVAEPASEMDRLNAKGQAEAESQELWFAQSITQRGVSVRIEDLDVIELEASATQINSLLADLQTHPEEFLKVAIEANPRIRARQAGKDRLSDQETLQLQVPSLLAAVPEAAAGNVSAEKKEAATELQKRAVSINKQQLSELNLAEDKKTGPRKSGRQSTESLEKNDDQQVTKPVARAQRLSTTTKQALSFAEEKGARDKRKSGSAGKESLGRAVRLQRAKTGKARGYFQKRDRLGTVKQKSLSKQANQKNISPQLVQVLIVLQAVDSPPSKPKKKEPPRNKEKKPTD